MVVIVVEKCPQSLRGDLTKWLQEISPGVYVGRVSARVRDSLWDRVRECIKGGRATMVFSAQNEQHFDFRVHNTTWEPVDYDGLKLMMRPSAGRLKVIHATRRKFSKASQQKLLTRKTGKRKPGEPAGYVVLDLETTGLTPEDEIIEIGAVKFVNGVERGRFQTLVRLESELPSEVTKLTGITPEMVAMGESPANAANGLLAFVGSLPVVVHNADFDLAYIDALLDREDCDELDNEIIDTLSIARKKLPNLHGHSLDALSSYYGLTPTVRHRALEDALLDRAVFLKLIES